MPTQYGSFHWFMLANQPNSFPNLPHEVLPWNAWGGMTLQSSKLDDQPIQCSVRCVSATLTGPVPGHGISGVVIQLG